MEAKEKPAQSQEQQPGIESEMHPAPRVDSQDYIGSNKLQGKVAIITGGDSGIGKATAIYYAKEGADIAIVYLNEDQDAKDTQARITAIGQKCLLIKGNIQDPNFCKQCIEDTVSKFGKLNVLVNNAAEQHSSQDIQTITPQQIENTFRTNIFSMFYLSQAAVKHLKSGDSIINTTSVTAYRGTKHLLDYSTTKGAIVSFTRSLAAMLAEQGIRVNGVAPGPVWTPLIPATLPAEKVEKFGANVPLQRPAEPCEIAPCYVFLASDDASYMTGQILHPNGGEIVGG